MDKLTKIFQSGEVLQAQDLNTIKEKVNELVDKVVTLQEKIDSISLNYIIAEDIDVTLSLNSISINDGAASTSELAVSAKFVCSGTPTHYMLSENPSFSGASWTAFANPAPFTLSSGNGSKTVYAKIKDASGESSVKSDSIAYAPAASLSLTSITINDGASSTNNLAVNVKFACSGSPTHYMLSESSTFVGASWVAFISPAQFTLSAGEGSKTVYAKIKDVSNESSVKNDSIEYSVNPPVVELALNSISINNGAASTSALPVSVGFTYTGTPTHYMLSESPSFSGGTWRAFSSPASFTLSSGNGTKTIYAKIKDASGESLVKSDSIAYSPPISGNIVFTDAEFKRVMVSRYDTSGDGEISIPEAEAVTAWGSEMFNNTVVTNMDELKYFKNASSIFNGAFSGCTSLESIEYPDNWEMKGPELKGCTSLIHIKFPANLTEISTSAFENTTSLENLEFPSTVKKINTNAFLNSGLVRAVIPDATTDIGNLGNNCAKLVFADLGDGVTNFGQNAFVGSPIEILIIRAVKVPTMGYNALKDITAQIYVPDASVALYKAATWWSAHAARIHPLSEYQG